MAKRKTLQQMEDEFFTEFDRPEVRELIVGLGGIDPCKKGSYIGGVIGGGTGPQGEPGPMGPQGPKGEQGDPMTFDSLTDAQKEALRGPKGDKGDPMTFNDLTDAQKEALRGPKGDKGDPMTFDSLTDAQKAALKGATGATGPQGPKGDTGPQGPQGVQGPKGDKGDKGDQGESEPLPPSDGKIYVMKDQAWTQLNFELVTGEAGAGAGTVTVRPVFDWKSIAKNATNWKSLTWYSGNNSHIRTALYCFSHNGDYRLFYGGENGAVCSCSVDDLYTWKQIKIPNSYNNMYNRTNDLSCVNGHVHEATYNTSSSTVNQAQYCYTPWETPVRTITEIDKIGALAVASSANYTVRANATTIWIHDNNHNLVETKSNVSGVRERRDLRYSPKLDLFVMIETTKVTCLNGNTLEIETVDVGVPLRTPRWWAGAGCFVAWVVNVPWVSTDGLTWVPLDTSLPGVTAVNDGVAADEVGVFFVGCEAGGAVGVYMTSDLRHWTPLTGIVSYADSVAWDGNKKRLYASCDFLCYLDL